MKRRSEKTEAIVVRLIDYGESDLIVGLLSSQFGRISAFASGARVSKKRFGNVLDLFALLHVEITPSKNSDHQLWRLSGASLIDLYLGIRNNLQKFATATYLSECIWLFAAENHPEPKLFHWWNARLRDLAAQDVIDPGNSQLDLELLKLCGYGPRWDICSECGKSPSGGRLFFSFERGCVACASCKRVGEGNWIQSATAQKLSQGLEPPREERSEVRRTIDAFLNYTIGRQPLSQSFRNEVLHEAR